MGAAVSTSLQNRLVSECGDRSPPESTVQELTKLYAETLEKTSSSEDAFQAVKKQYEQIEPQTKDEAAKDAPSTAKGFLQQQ